MSKQLPNTPAEVLHLNASRPLLTGKFICGGTIVLGHLLGKGGFGQVYRAELVRSRTVLAVKVVNRPAIKQTSLQHHLCQEIKIHGKMSDDPSVPSLYHVYEDEDNVYLVMVRYLPLNLLALHPCDILDIGYR
jgi:serine/threonine protein kinase